MRASRLVRLLGLLQVRGPVTARQLAGELEVSERTILRDIEALSAAGIPVYAVRGCQGGFALLPGFTSDLPVPGAARDRLAGGHQMRRARVRLSPRGRRLAALLGRPVGVRVRKTSAPTPGREDWVEASVRIESVDSGVLDILALGPEVEVLHPPELRAQVGRAARRLAELHAGPSVLIPQLIPESSTAAPEIQPSPHARGGGRH
jgi:predicted DNA-binding transcriptional regulator YafY